MAKIWGHAGGDDVVGTIGDDTFNLWQGGNDYATGDSGNDDFRFRDTFNNSDNVDGGNGYDRIVLQGDYSAGLTLSSSFLTGVEGLRLLGAFDYNITIDDDFLSGGRFTVNAPLKGDHGLTFDASTETDASFTIFASGGNDTISTGDGRDHIHLSKGGEDIVHAGDGDDQIVIDGSLTADDQIDGGVGFNDEVFLNGDYDGANAVVFNDTTMTAVETLRLADGHNYDLTLADGTVDSFTNLTLTVDAQLLGPTHSARIDGSLEADSNYTMLGGKGGDTFIGGAYADTLVGHVGNDTLEGRGGFDTIIGGAGVDTMTGGSEDDTFVYHGANESSGTTYDFITDAHFGISFRPPPSDHGVDALPPPIEMDFIKVPVAVTSALTTSHSISEASFSDDLAAAAGPSFNGALVVDADGGDLFGHSYLIINMNGNTTYDAGTDIVIEVTGYSGFVSPDNFI